jgi:hypothetical protein
VLMRDVHVATFFRIFSTVFLPFDDHDKPLGCVSH